MTHNGPAAVFGIYRASFIRGLFLLLVQVTSLPANDLESLFRSGDIQACEARLEQVSSESERLLIRSMRVRDPQAWLNYMRSISGLKAPDWVRREALLALCDHFCLGREADSLSLWSKKFMAHTGTEYSCAPMPVAQGIWFVQVGAFSSEGNAARALQKLSNAGIPVRVLRDGKHFRALAGPFDRKADAKKAGKDWKHRGLLNEYRAYKLEQRK